MQLTLNRVELAVIQNMVNPMYTPRGEQRAEDGVKSERRPVTGRITLQDLGYSEKKPTYTYGLNLR